MPNNKPSIHLGGTARSPKDVRSLYELGLQFVEIPITNPLKFSKQIKVYKDLKDSLGLYYLCHGPREGDPNNVNTLENEYLPKILKTLPLMKMLEMNIFSIHLWLDTRFVRQEVINFKIGLLKRIIEKAQDTGITICLENLSENASSMKDPFAALPALNLTLEVGHAQLLTKINRSYRIIEQYPEKIKHIHLHDNRGGDSARDDLHLLPGEGVVDFKRIFGRLKKIGYNRTITLELKPPEIKKCLGFVKKLIF